MRNTLNASSAPAPKATVKNSDEAANDVQANATIPKDVSDVVNAVAAREDRTRAGQLRVIIKAWAMVARKSLR